ncbi:hypothetical protein GYMLUDRAFT_71890 [Collybiopsis luxurians FD-317 M1]|uniref:2-dehydropantoate 2-reductase n=1 Tax=Collybiopsis luxurians FD-317 M1 TaxID=944289 RepID=A0A0D0CVN5_9AGAR|nr:hypothetical protein GYMLUDRAFT_71890 [Collybiopsis luxurians FD-317 M1]
MVKQDILVVGMGAVGTIYAYSLYRSDKVRLTVVARGNYELIKEHGMHIKSQRFGDVKGWKPDRVLDSVSSAADTQYSYVILATKCIPEIIKTPQILAPLLSSPYCDQFNQPTYVLLQNGLNIEVDLYHAIKALGKPEEPRIVNTGVYVFANLIEPNVVEHGPYARLDIGVYRPNDFTTTINSPEEQRLLDELGDMFHRRQDSNVNIFPEIQRQKFTKNILNIVYASLACLTRCSLASIFRPAPGPTDIAYEPYLEPATAARVNEITRKWMKDIFKECIRLGTGSDRAHSLFFRSRILGHAIGFPDSEDGLPSDFVDKNIKDTEKNYASPYVNHKPSTLLDIENGAPIEVEPIWGEAVRMARERSVDVPRIEMAYASLLLVQNQIIRRIKSAKQLEQ